MCPQSHSRKWQAQELNPGCLTPEPMLSTPCSLHLPTCLTYWTHFFILGTVYVEFVACGNFLKFSSFHLLPRFQVCPGLVSVFPMCPSLSLVAEWALCWWALCSEPPLSSPPLPRCLPLRPAYKVHPAKFTTGRTLVGFITGGLSATNIRLKEDFDDLVLGL